MVENGEGFNRVMVYFSNQESDCLIAGHYSNFKVIFKTHTTVTIDVTEYCLSMPFNKSLGEDDELEESPYATVVKKEETENETE
ncbi:hypothetical protein NPIL_23181 [Nephila pilipes]|uniref:Uncharacterized protein n=1 Tax=Nephila pilipes TaxID=299642 RepID=A0A8X6THG0_NEPPI|nr:hypothetical protein NPIL_23181 [Nephila pilipes]